MRISQCVLLATPYLERNASSFLLIKQAKYFMYVERIGKMKATKDVE